MNKDKFENWRERQQEKSESLKHSLAITIATVVTVLVASVVGYSWYATFTNLNNPNVSEIAQIATSTKVNVENKESNTYIKSIMNFTQRVTNKINRIYKKQSTQAEVSTTTE